MSESMRLLMWGKEKKYRCSITYVQKRKKNPRCSTNVVKQRQHQTFLWTLDLKLREKNKECLCIYSAINQCIHAFIHLIVCSFLHLIISSFVCHLFICSSLHRFTSTFMHHSCIIHSIRPTIYSQLFIHPSGYSLPHANHVFIPTVECSLINSC